MICSDIIAIKGVIRHNMMHIKRFCRSATLACMPISLKSKAHLLFPILSTKRCAGLSLTGVALPSACSANPLAITAARAENMCFLPPVSSPLKLLVTPVALQGYPALHCLNTLLKSAGCRTRFGGFETNFRRTKPHLLSAHWTQFLDTGSSLPIIVTTFRAKTLLGLLRGYAEYCLAPFTWTIRWHRRSNKVMFNWQA